MNKEDSGDKYLSITDYQSWGKSTKVDIQWYGDGIDG